MRVLLLLLTLAFSPFALAQKPNILIILADDLGYGELGCQGFTEQVPTPHIDSLARHGIRFTSGYVSAPVCSPSRAGLLTGRYQQRFGHEFNPAVVVERGIDFGLALTERTMGDRFRGLGYATGWFGKSHLGFKPPFHPLRRGFDRFFGFLGGVHDYFAAALPGYDPILNNTKRVARIDYTTAAFAGQAASFIGRRREQPWLCYLAFNAVHVPVEAPASYLARFAHVRGEARRKFCGNLSAMDDAIGEVLDRLRATGQEENTLIFFLSDNGGPTPETTSGNGPLRGFKGQTWEGGIRIPFIIQWKGHLPEGVVDDRPIIQLDVLPTALAAAGTAAPEDWKLDGVNLLPYLSGESSGPPHPALFWRLGPQMAVRQGAWKLVKGEGLPDTVPPEAPATVTGAQLYNLDLDPAETNNLAAQEPGRVKALGDLWGQWNSELAPPSWFPVSYGDYSAVILLDGLPLGHLEATVSFAGAVTGHFTMRGDRRRFLGKLDAASHFTQVFPNDGGSLSLTFTADEDGQSLVSGTLTEGGQVLTIESRTGLGAGPAPDVTRGEYTCVLSGGAAASGQPAGAGWLRLTVKPHALVHAVGRLPDATLVSLGGRLDADGKLAIIERLRGHPAGYFSGTASFGPSALNEVTGTFQLTQPAKANHRRRFPEGFTLNGTIAGDRYSPPEAGRAPLNFTEANSPLLTAAFTGGDLQANLSTTVVLAVSGHGVGVPVGAPTRLKISRSFGVMIGTVEMPGGQRTRFTGVVRRTANVAVGNFVSPDQTGTVTLTPR